MEHVYFPSANEVTLNVIGEFEPIQNHSKTQLKANRGYTYWNVQ